MSGINFVRDAVNRYLIRTGAGDAYQRDAQYSLQWKWIERMLQTVDMALEDAEVDPAVRRRVITTVIYGGPDPEAAEARIAKFNEAVKDLSRGHGLRL